MKVALAASANLELTPEQAMALPLWRRVEDTEPHARAGYMTESGEMEIQEVPLSEVRFVQEQGAFVEDVTDLPEDVVKAVDTDSMVGQHIAALLVAPGLKHVAEKYAKPSPESSSTDLVPSGGPLLASKGKDMPPVSLLTTPRPVIPLPAKEVKKRVSANDGLMFSTRSEDEQKKASQETAPEVRERRSGQRAENGVRYKWEQVPYSNSTKLWALDLDPCRHGFPSATLEDAVRRAKEQDDEIKATRAREQADDESVDEGEEASSSSSSSSSSDSNTVRPPRHTGPLPLNRNIFELQYSIEKIHEFELDKAKKASSSKVVGPDGKTPSRLMTAIAKAADGSPQEWAEKSVKEVKLKQKRKLQQVSYDKAKAQGLMDEHLRKTAVEIAKREQSAIGESGICSTRNLILLMILYALFLVYFLSGKVATDAANMKASINLAKQELNSYTYNPHTNSNSGGSMYPGAIDDTYLPDPKETRAKIEKMIQEGRERQNAGSNTGNKGTRGDTKGKQKTRKGNGKSK